MSFVLMDPVIKLLFAWMLPWVLRVFGFSVDATETPAISAWCLVSAEGRSVRKSQTCPRSYLLLAGSLQAYLLLAGSSVKLIFIGWLLLRTASKLCRAEVEVEEGTARMTGTDTDSSITSVGKTHNPVSTFRMERHTDYRQSHYCFSFSLLLTSSAATFYFPLLHFCHCFDLKTDLTRHVAQLVDA